ncbi:hypothetical protein WJX64_04520 [Leifsonia sp. YIM 134122]|uniref:Protein kinase domain-containing protein n=1 Tax=Leifsonia stereocauli TaxID=3134136 RepID=A0ABU9W1E2_9MICO
MTRDDSTRLAGYRVLRRLGSGRRAEVHLGHAGDAAAGAPGERTVALKLFSAASAASSAADIAILGSVPAACVPRLHDVATLRDGSICLVLDRLDGPTLSTWLAAERRPQPGELVTVLGAVIGTVAAVRAAGWSLGELVPSSVRFDRSGRPVITSFSSARELDDGGSGVDVLRLELRHLGDFIADVLVLARHSDPGFLAWLRTQEGAHPLTDRLPELEARVFDWAPARAVVLAAPDGPAGGSAVPARLAPFAASGAPPAPPDSDDDDDGSTGPAILRAVRWARALLTPTRMRSVVRTFVGRHRRPVILAGTVLVVGAGAVLSLVPPAAQGTPPPPPSDSAPTGPAESSVSASPSVPATAAPRETTTDLVDMGDDPLAAAAVLLSARQDCLELGEAPCLAAVDQASSPLDQADRHALATGGAPLPLLPSDAITLIGRTGDAAIVAVPGPTADTPAASLLLMKGEAGWRLREVFEG